MGDIFNCIHDTTFDVFIAAFVYHQQINQLLPGSSDRSG